MHAGCCGKEAPRPFLVGNRKESTRPLYSEATRPRQCRRRLPRSYRTADQRRIGDYVIAATHPLSSKSAANRIQIAVHRVGRNVHECRQNAFENSLSPAYCVGMTLLQDSVIVLQ